MSHEQAIGTTLVVEHVTTYEVNSCVGSYCNTEEGYLHWHLMCMNTSGQFSHLCVICVVCSEFCVLCFEFMF